ncbi:MAG: tRNA (adenosine(37)-N6)-threonylcarbamoyltransferase complex transferase subunit TsaD [Patescibacteria group bacterium]
MRIFGIETSCDETAMAIVEGKGDRVKVKANIVASQMKLHEKYGGVVPEVAARQHVETIIPMLSEIVPPNGKGIDAIAVTYGPGLVPALRVGVELGRTLSLLWQKPLIGVNHLEGHIYSNWLKPRYKPMVFPALVLIVSGKHTEIVLMKGYGKYQLLGETRDDAAGEAFDKVARILGLPYPGGPAVSRLAKEGNGSRFDLPRPMIDSKDFDFSFSGLKTAVLYTWREAGEKKALKADMAASFQEAAVGVLVGKMTKAIALTKPKTVMIAGGVAANEHLRSRLGKAIKKQFPKVKFIVPEMKYTGDNAAMIAAAGYFRALKKDFVDPRDLEANPNLGLV